MLSNLVVPASIVMVFVDHGHFPKSKKNDNAGFMLFRIIDLKVISAKWSRVVLPSFWATLFTKSPMKLTYRPPLTQFASYMFPFSPDSLWPRFWTAWHQFVPSSRMNTSIVLFWHPENGGTFYTTRVFRGPLAPTLWLALKGTRHIERESFCITSLPCGTKYHIVDLFFCACRVAKFSCALLACALNSERSG